MNNISRDLPDETATVALAIEIANAIDCPIVIALWGDLGAGKTSFARAFIRTLAQDAQLEVPSPTFTLAQNYHSTKGTIWHFDLYRLESPDEALEIGFEDALADSIILVEWPERLGPQLPPRRIDIRLSLTPDGTARHANLVFPEDAPLA